MTDLNTPSPAYKGVSLACSTLLELLRLDPQTWSSISYSFNCKEIKDHGEGGSIVGAPLKGKNALVMDDVVGNGSALARTSALGQIKIQKEFCVQATCIATLVLGRRHCHPEDKWGNEGYGEAGGVQEELLI